MNNEIIERIKQQLFYIYRQKTAEEMWERLQITLENFSNQNPNLLSETIQYSEKDAILIVYGDQLQEGKYPPLKLLDDFLQTYLTNSVSGVHILPFFPYSSDDGFSVIGYTQINPDFGTWENIETIAQNFILMVDFVLNHISRQSDWFQKFKKGDPEYQDFFIAVDPDTDLSSIVRPRTSPLLTPIETSRGTVYVWTTFSSDQIDLNYANPEVTLQMLDILLEYVCRGAKIIRLDAIAYLWKTIGTSSIHLPQAHHFVKLTRAILDAVAPGVILITETNVPHDENISYLGKPIDLIVGEHITHTSDEAQMIYQFSLAPLVLHSFHHSDATALTHWVEDLSTPFREAVFFNFLASHDGIGIRPAEGILTTKEIQELVDRTLQHGGKVSYKNNPDGSKSAYELNITLYDWLADPESLNPELDIERFLASQVIMLSLAGIPGIYFHSLIGSSNCQECVAETGRARSINREKFQYLDLIVQLKNTNSRAHQIFKGYTKLLEIRRTQPAFHPQVGQEILNVDDRVFGLLRRPLNQGREVLALINVSGQEFELVIECAELDITSPKIWLDLLSGKKFETASGKLQVEIRPFQYLWLTPAD